MLKGDSYSLKFENTWNIFPFFYNLLLWSQFSPSNLQGFTLEDATGLAIKGDVDVHSIYALFPSCLVLSQL